MWCVGDDKMQMSTLCFRNSFSNVEQMQTVLSQALKDTRECVSVKHEDTWFDIRLILQELCLNALEHGGKPVEVLMTLCSNDNSLRILVSDSGTGFTPEPDAKIDPDNERGRGLMIVSSLADSLKFNKAANKVVAKIQL